jgi:hypothetical protein
MGHLEAMGLLVAAEDKLRAARLMLDERRSATAWGCVLVSMNLLTKVRDALAANDVEPPNYP